MSKSAMYMSARELLEKFGTGKKGSRKVSGEMVAWLLTDPPRAAVDAAAILKIPVQPPSNQLVVMNEDTVHVEFGGFNFGVPQPADDQYTAHITSYTNIVGIPDARREGKLTYLRDDSAGNPSTD